MNEPLAELAAFAFDWAHCLCEPKLGCETYHRAWSMVRHIESDGALPAGADFFGTELRKLAHDGCIRVLLSGAADTGLAALVLNALRPHGIEPEIILVDCCLTTLEQNRLFARHANFDLQTHHMDVRNLTVAPVDAIIVHSFLHFFVPEARQGVVDMWARCLAPTGRILISHRLSIAKAAPRAVPSAPELAQRKAEISTKMLADGYSKTRIAAVVEAAEALWLLRYPNPRLHEDELFGLLMNAGLAVLQMEKDASSKSVSPMVSKLDANLSARVEIIAGRLEESRA